MSSSTYDAEKKVNENIAKASSNAQEEVTRLRAELDELRRKAGPKVREAENFLTSPTAIGFYQGMAFLSSCFFRKNGCDLRLGKQASSPV